MDLPIDNPDKTFEDYADVVAESLYGYENIVLVGHSRAGNVIPRVAGRLPLRRLVFLASSFEPATIGHPPANERDNVPEKNLPLFTDGIEYIGNNMTIFKKQLAKDVFYQDCKNEVADWAISRLRPQRRSADEPVLAKWPSNIPQDFIICRDDRVVNPEWGSYVARNWLNIEPRYLEGDHSPALSRPAVLGRLLLSLAQ